MDDLIAQVRVAINNHERSAIGRMFDLAEDTDSVRGPGWYEASCRCCGWTTTGYEPVAEDAACEHVGERHRDEPELRLVEPHRAILEWAQRRNCAHGEHLLSPPDPDELVDILAGVYGIKEPNRG